jgi:hypothetical protein
MGDFLINKAFLSKNQPSYGLTGYPFGDREFTDGGIVVSG